MPRSRGRFWVLLLAVGLSCPLLDACSSASTEQQVLINFFRAARLRDNTTLANMAAVSFDPRTDGTVQNFTIAKIGGERRTTLTSERATAVESLTPPGQPDIDLSKLKVDVISEDVTVKADVR